MSERWSWQPLAMALVSSGSRGNKLLLCYYGNEYSPAQDSERDLLSKLPRRTLAELLAPSSVMVGRKFELRVDEWRFVGHPFSLQTDMWSASFNVVFVLQANCSPDVVIAYEQLSQVIGAGLVHEEHRCGYLRHQFHQLMQVGEDLDEMDTTADRKSLEGIPLASSLFSVLNNLQGGNPHVLVKLNGWTEISFLVHTPVVTHFNDESNIGKMVVPSGDAIPYVKPYTALLLVKNVDDIIASLPCSYNPSLHRFLNALSPVKNLQQVSLDVDLPLRQALQFAAHLVHWGCAMTVYPLSESNVYVTSVSADTIRGSKLMAEFQKWFPYSKVLPSLLAHFSTPVQLGEMTDMYPNEQLIPLVAWLLQHKQIEQLHTYIYIVKPYSQPMQRSAFTSPRQSVIPFSSPHHTSPHYSNTDHQSDQQKHGTAKPASEKETLLLRYLSREEVGWVLNTTAASAAPANNEDLSLFASLCQYFHGSHHLEEVMMMENMTRSQLLTLIDKFSEVLVTCALPEHNNKL